MKKTIFCAIAALVLVLGLVLIPTGANAQSENFASLPATEATQSVSLNIAGLHYAYEHPLARRATIIGRAGVDAGATWGSNMLFGSYSYWMIAPSIDIEPRFYYGLDRREARGRSTTGNASSFLSVQMKNVLPFGYVSDSDLTIYGATSFTPMWGMRRVWADHWLFEFTAGFSLAWGWGGGFGTSPHLGVRFGYAF